MEKESFLFDWIKTRLDQVPYERRPWVLGVNGPQGSGKTTLTRQLVERFAAIGIRAVTLSIDDFYLTRVEQIALAHQYPLNPLLQQRGYPGTHDIELGVKTLDALKEISKIKKVEIPVYEKSMHQGEGDRLSSTEWKRVTAPVDLVFFEGWMLGFPMVPEENLPNENFLVVNQFLKDYQVWNQRLDGFIQLVPEEISYVTQWRVEAEEKMKEQGKPGMSKEAIEAYIQKFLPAYEVYLPQLIQHPPLQDHFIRLTISKNRKMKS